MPLATTYHQSQDQRWRTHNATEDGVCFALSIQFILCKAKGESFDPWLVSSGPGPDAAQMLSTIIARMVEQDRRVQLANDTFVQAKYEYAVELIEKGTGLKSKRNDFGLPFDMLNTIKYNWGQTPAIWADQLSRDKGLKYVSIVGERGGKSFTHGIAISVDSAGWGIFDPNFGIYAASDKESFAQDLDDLFEKKYTSGQVRLRIEKASFTTFY